ncbi:hypothetical protein [Brevundimonas sp. Root1279]|uniref:hypothetical protein n=1 Tax=Brevundimonas sp. Root1279 TaxID=1736443 RepID=UPI0006F471BA|nr:hypothetical protein [Brevundimonas sp. Root1279]KQW79798.1 hypothetical protein ASC65_14730 [Brevundimonas sp. Root1279]
MIKIANAVGIATLVVAIWPAVALGQSVPGLADLVGARGSSAESELASKGYALAKNVGAASMWWNAGTRTCASVLVENGRVQSIEPASARDCGQAEIRANPGYQNHGVSSERTTVAQMPRYCAGAAAAKFHQSPQNISTQTPIPDHGMYSVFGQYPPDGAGTVFICTFTHEGTLVSVDSE